MILAVHSDSVVDVQGTLAGQALHFEREADGFHALGGVPFGSDSAVAQIVRSYADGMVDTATVPLPVRRRRLPGERLRVAPEFARPPDSLKERIRLESELVDGFRERAHETPRLWHEPFLRPRPSRITSGFGTPRIFNGEVRSRHYGVDFAGELGAPVEAANRGVVALVADLYYSGTTVLIDHGAGLVTGYFHLSRVSVVPGDTVERGQVIGLVGATGRVTRSHLHWWGTYGEITVNPLDLLKLGGNLEWQGRGNAKARRTDAQR
ncbi:MAG TPA: M23 family metallopeptidase [Gemmatimonadales bacterium]|nr:M23 family metallopeptidase [Gemmatimonadales bacterium]